MIPTTGLVVDQVRDVLAELSDAIDEPDSPSEALYAIWSTYMDRTHIAAWIRDFDDLRLIHDELDGLVRYHRHARSRDAILRR